MPCIVRYKVIVISFMEGAGTVSGLFRLRLAVDLLWIRLHSVPVRSPFRGTGQVSGLFRLRPGCGSAVDPAVRCPAVWQGAALAAVPVSIQKGQG